MPLGVQGILGNSSKQIRLTIFFVGPGTQKISLTQSRDSENVTGRPGPGPAAEEGTGIPPSPADGPGLTGNWACVMPWRPAGGRCSGGRGGTRPMAVPGPRAGGLGRCRVEPRRRRRSVLAGPGHRGWP